MEIRAEVAAPQMVVTASGIEDVARGSQLGSMRSKNAAFGVHIVPHHTRVTGIVQVPQLRERQKRRKKRHV